jgi:hypothetical protein
MNDLKDLKIALILVAVVMGFAGFSALMGILASFLPCVSCKAIYVFIVILVLGSELAGLICAFKYKSKIIGAIEKLWIGEGWQPNKVRRVFESLFKCCKWGTNGSNMKCAAKKPEKAPNCKQPILKWFNKALIVVAVVLSIMIVVQLILLVAGICVLFTCC